MDVFLVMRKGKRFFGGMVDITFMKRSDKNFSEAKVVVSQKVAKKAVDRHKIQRRLREIVRHEFKTNPAAAGRGYDMVVVARASSLRASFDDLQKSVESVFARIS
jgi:ribonuclease P protein component